MDTLDHVRRELAVLYHQGKAGDRDVSDASKLAHILSAIGRLLEGPELQARVAALEEKLAELGQP